MTDISVDIQIRDQQLKQQSALVISGGIAIIVTISGWILRLPWILIVPANIPLMVTGLVILVTARGFAVRLRRINALIWFLSGLFLTGLSLPDEPDSGLQKLDGNLALAASLALIACVVVLAILLYPFTVDGWRARGESGVLQLIQRLDHQDTLFRAQAAEFLGELGDSRAVEPLVNALQDGESMVRANAAVALGRLGDIQALPALRELKQDQNRYVGIRPLASVAAEAIAALEEQQQNKQP